MENNKHMKQQSFLDDDDENNDNDDAVKSKLFRHDDGNMEDPSSHPPPTQKPPRKIYRIRKQETSTNSTNNASSMEQKEKEVSSMLVKEEKEVMTIDDGGEETTLLLQSSKGDHIMKKGTPLAVAESAGPDFTRPTSFSHRGAEYIGSPPQQQGAVDTRPQEQLERIVTAQMVDEEAMADEILRNRSEDIRNRIIGHAVVATRVEKDEGYSRKKWSISLLICACLLAIIGVVLGITLTRDDGDDGTPTPTEIPSETPTNAPSLSEFEELVQLLSSVTAREVLLDKSTTQNRALEWLHNEDSYDSGDNPVTLLNRYVLALLYFSTNGATWFNPLNFLSNTSECEWPPVVEGEGRGTNVVRCNEEGELVRIRLDLNNLNGTLPEELSSRKSLELLSASTNSIHGTIPPSFGELVRLDTLELAENKMTGPLPDTLGRLTKLEHLNLNTNELTGTIPPDVAMIGSLESVLLQENMFVGTIPEFVPRSGLAILLLGANGLSGTIPTSIYTLPALHVLQLSENALSGTISTEIGSVSKLMHLDLLDNALTGTLPSELGELIELTDLVASVNLINGTIPTEVGKLNRLEALGLYILDLTGTIPSSLAGLTFLTALLVNDNPLTGVVPSELSQLPFLGAVDISNTNLTGSVSDIFCRNDPLPTIYMFADCEEVDCPCCTYCCNDATGRCTTEYDQICRNLGILEELYGQFGRGTECSCSDDGRVLSCADACQACNFDGTVCLESYDFGFTLPDSGFDNMWRCNMQYTLGREGNISYTTDRYTFPRVCEVMLDGIPCDSCELNACQDGLFGLRIDCRNVQEGAILDSCDRSVGNDGAGWLPLGEIEAGDCYSCFQ